MGSLMFTRALVLAILSLSLLSGTASMAMTNIVVDQVRDSRFVIVTSTGKVPDQIRDAVSGMHPGWFVLTNQSSLGIKALICRWDYTSSDGNIITRDIKFDGYTLVPASDVVPPNHSVLVSLTGMIADSSFQSIALGTPMSESVSYPIPFQDKDVTSVEIHIDSIILSDGEIIGPNTSQYEDAINDRFRAIQSVLADIQRADDDANRSGVPKSHREIVERMAANEKGSKDLERRLILKRILRRNDVNEGIEYFSKCLPPPHFYNSRGGLQK